MIEENLRVIESNKARFLTILETLDGTKSITFQNTVEGTAETVTVSELIGFAQEHLDSGELVINSPTVTETANTNKIGYYNQSVTISQSLLFGNSAGTVSTALTGVFGFEGMSAMATPEFDLTDKTTSIEFTGFTIPMGINVDELQRSELNSLYSALWLSRNKINENIAKRERLAEGIGAEFMGEGEQSGFSAQSFKPRVPDWAMFNRDLDFLLPTVNTALEKNNQYVSLVEKR